MIVNVMNPSNIWLSLALTLSLTSMAIAADEEAENKEEASNELLAGHSAHGEAFNEGPRQAAYLMGQYQ